MHPWYYLLQKKITLFSSNSNQLQEMEKDILLGTALFTESTKKKKWPLSIIDGSCHVHDNEEWCLLATVAWLNTHGKSIKHASPSPFKFNKYINIETESKFSSVTRTIALKSVQLKDNLHLLIHLELILSTSFFFFLIISNPQGGTLRLEKTCASRSRMHLFGCGLWSNG